MDYLTSGRLALLACGLALYCISLAVYRLYFSPLAKFPGPRLAAVTLWYEFYYDVVKRGRYTWKIGELHARYGPIVRINPFELHIDDVEYYDELYVGSSRRTMKYEWFTRSFGRPISTFATASHERHRIRRAAVSPYFSKASVTRLEPLVQSLADKLTARLDGFKGTGNVVNLVDAFTALTADIIVQYTFAKPYRLLDKPEFAPLWHKGIMDASEASHQFKQFGWMEPTMRRIPAKIVEMMSPQLVSLILLGDMIRAQILGVKAELAEGKKPDNEGQKTIFYDLLQNEQLPPEDKTVDRLELEGVALVAAGSMTVALTLSVISFHLIKDKRMRERLQTELKGVVSQPHAQPKWNQLEQLPYLSAIIQEGLRWGYGVTHRLQRISPDVALHYKEWTIPAGTPVGMTSVLMHNNPTLFPNPRTFSPERWLQPRAAELRKYVVSFSKGSRQCLGMNLAYCELFLTTAAVFAPGRFEFEFFETDVSDIEIEHDFFNASHRVDSKGVRVSVG